MTDKIADEHHVLRHVKSSWIVEVPGEGTTVIHEAFVRRPGENALSCAWLEYYAGDPEQQLCASVAVFRQNLDIKKRSGFVRGNVGEIKAASAAHASKARIIRAPEPNHAAHSEVRQLDDTNQVLLELLASETWSDLRFAHTIP